MKTLDNTPLLLSFIIVVVIFLLFTGGAITMTIMNESLNKNGVFNNISWLWVPAMVSLLVSCLLGWVILVQTKKNP